MFRRKKPTPQQTPNVFVFTGPSSAGKTTLIEVFLLTLSLDHLLPDGAREKYIKDGIDLPGIKQRLKSDINSLSPMRDKIVYKEEVFRKFIIEQKNNPNIDKAFYDGPEGHRYARQQRQHAEQNLKPKQTYLFDRAVPDTIAFHKWLKCKIEKELIAELHAYFDLKNGNRYDRVFLVNPVPFVKDGVRFDCEDEKQRENLYRLQFFVYGAFGYQPISLDVYSDKKSENVEARLRILFNTIIETLQAKKQLPVLGEHNIDYLDLAMR